MIAKLEQQSSQLEQQSRTWQDRSQAWEESYLRAEQERSHLTKKVEELIGRLVSPSANFVIRN